MKLSIIIPVYNVEQYIATCIKSLLRQGFNSSDYEIIVVDDGSEDNSVKIVEQFQPKNANISIYSKENAGVGSARNYGVKHAKGDYIYFIDPDDYLADNTLKVILSYAENKDIEVLTFLSKGTTDFSLNKSTTSIKDNFNITVVSGIDYIGRNGYKNEIWWYIIKREFLNKIDLRFIEGRWMEDAIFTANLITKADKIGHLPIDSHRHVKVAGSAMTNKEPSHYLKVIYDNANAAKVFKPLIEGIKNSKENKACIDCLKTRQQSFVFFLMIRMLKSTIRLKEAKKLIKSMQYVEAYPLNSFLGKDYNGFTYSILVRLFNVKNIYYLLFLVLNPILRLKK